VNAEDFSRHDGLGLAAPVRDGAVSAAELLDAAIAVAPFFTRDDALLTPSMCRPPHPFGIIDMMTDDEAGYTQAVLGTTRSRRLWNACGNPAMSAPLAWSRAGLPIGVQFIAAF
jgi:amidase